jgi:SNF2 family DNA or RNA helicase
MHCALATYARSVWRIAEGRTDLQLVATVLMKRALSSAGSLLVSVNRRLALLASDGDPSNPLQDVLPFEASVEDSDLEPAMAAAALPAASDERAMLEQLRDAAIRAARSERKLVALRRLLRRVREPAIVFTEYRDTLGLLAAASGDRRPVMLHGGMNHDERRVAISTFTTGGADLLLATDAGAEGLNLHARCRLVVNLELPWNPVRLEQRIGRVDRLGQTRTVHAVHLFASDTAESRVLARLFRRVDRIRTEADITLDILRDVHDTAQNRR